MIGVFLESCRSEAMARMQEWKGNEKSNPFILLGTIWLVSSSTIGRQARGLELTRFACILPPSASFKVLVLTGFLVGSDF